MRQRYKINQKLPIAHQTHNSYDQSVATVEPCRVEEELGVRESPFTLANFSFESLYIRLLFLDSCYIDMVL